uniref:Uncharacterized protein n=1 Tax=Rhizochromulina marina TaxID=1034831 RepID=A0A7S2S6K8_9STRA|mmetsp:Transcript_25583/g.74676  ORF Transcript_25583/g.74676 Transcript_25583/m.74676 type:complete len:172 (+) Transcript_25583:231-746(+)
MSSPMKRLVGPLTVLGLLGGFLFSFEFFRETGPQVLPLLQLAAWTFPILAFGSWALSCVSSDDLASRGAYRWEVYAGFMVLGFVASECATVVLYMGYQMVMEALEGNLQSAMDHGVACAGAMAFAFVAVQLVDMMESRAAKRRTTRATATRRQPGNPRNSADVEINNDHEL